MGDGHCDLRNDDSIGVQLQQSGRRLLQRKRKSAHYAAVAVDAEYDNEKKEQGCDGDNYEEQEEEEEEEEEEEGEKVRRREGGACWKNVSRKRVGQVLFLSLLLPLPSHSPPPPRRRCRRHRRWNQKDQCRRSAAPQISFRLSRIVAKRMYYGHLGVDLGATERELMSSPIVATFSW